MEFPTIPYGDVFESGIDWLNRNAGWFFTELSEKVKAFIVFLEEVLLTPPPLMAVMALVLAVAVIAWKPVRRGDVLWGTYLGLLLICAMTFFRLQPIAKDVTQLEQMARVSTTLPGLAMVVFLIAALVLVIRHWEELRRQEGLVTAGIYGFLFAGGCMEVGLLGTPISFLHLALGAILIGVPPGPGSEGNSRGVSLFLGGVLLVFLYWGLPFALPASEVTVGGETELQRLWQFEAAVGAAIVTLATLGATLFAARGSLPAVIGVVAGVGLYAVWCIAFGTPFAFSIAFAGLVGGLLGGQLGWTAAPKEEQDRFNIAALLAILGVFTMWYLFTLDAMVAGSVLLVPVMMLLARPWRWWPAMVPLALCAAAMLWGIVVDLMPRTGLVQPPVAIFQILLFVLGLLLLGTLLWRLHRHEAIGQLRRLGLGILGLVLAIAALTVLVLSLDTLGELNTQATAIPQQEAAQPADLAPGEQPDGGALAGAGPAAKEQASLGTIYGRMALQGLYVLLAAAVLGVLMWLLKRVPELPLAAILLGFVIGWVELLQPQLGYEQVLMPPSVRVIVAIGFLAWGLSSYGVAWFTVIGSILVATMGLWGATMQTLALVLVSTVLALAVGVPVGIIAAKKPVIHTSVRPVLDLMQTMPPFVYLIPAILFFDIGKVPGAMATVIFAMPPAVRLTSLGIQQVSAEVVEAAEAFGATPRQLLVKVQLPIALPTILAGVNQTIMLALSMVVIAAMIGAGGLGDPVLKGITQLRIGLGFESGIAVVILAMCLDRITQSLGQGNKGN